jgi:hypothetical protein
MSANLSMNNSIITITSQTTNEEHTYVVSTHNTLISVLIRTSLQELIYFTSCGSLFSYLFISDLEHRIRGSSSIGPTRRVGPI